ncbi:MAG TPA: alpha/beta hydrolase [Gemmatimonadaceae bacterium]|jgi:acetyl esterase/lipase|nr:alpha/beta hydrolase [Gemmatimonadaceae bacterium]
MTAHQPGRTRRVDRSALLALGGSLAIVVLAALRVMPVWTMPALPVALATSELSPAIALVALIWLALSLWLLAHRPVWRAIVAVVLLGTALFSLRPLLQARGVASLVRESLPPAATAGATAASAPEPLASLPAATEVREQSVDYAASDGTPLTMRVYRNTASRGARPIVVVIYGGAWRGGDAGQGARISRALAQHGYLVAAIDYRHAPRHVFPAQLDDVRRSIALACDSAARWSGDTTRIALLGRSAGGHLAELAAFAPNDRPVRAVVALYAPWNLVEGYRDVPAPDPIDVRARISDFLDGTPEARPTRYHEASPSSYVRPALPPTLLLFGARDHLVKPEFNREAASALWAASDRVVSIELPWSEHGFDLVPGGLGERIAYAATVRFLDRELLGP